MWKKYKLYVIAAAVSAVAAIAVYFGVLGDADLNLSDLLFQRPQALERRIVILGIDDETLEYFGPIQTWTRDIYADTVDLLYADAQAHPLAVGMDVLFTGESEEQIDAQLVESCRGKEGIVVGTLAEFDSELVIDDEGFGMEDYHVTDYSEPYDALKAVTEQGFINNMMGSDGVARNAILKIELPDGRKAESLTYKLYQLYAREHGLPENLEQSIPMNDRYQWYIPFSGGPGAYEVYPLSGLFTGEVTGADLEGCIVLIGAYAEGLQDSFFTAADHSRKTNGVEIHANILDAMINGEFKSYVPTAWQCAFIFVLLSGLTVLFRKSKIRYSTLVWAAVTAGYLAAARLVYDGGYIVTVIYVPIFVTALYITEVGINYVRTSFEKRQVERTFKRYVAPQVVDEIFKTDEESLGLGGKLTDIACLFVDIRGFTAMSEKMEAAQVVGILNSYLELTSRCIMENGGTLDKYIGDATMALFNAPLPQEDYIYKAVKTACDMVEGSIQFAKELEEKYGRTVSFGVGVHCGKAVVGNIGTRMRMDYTAIGDTVNTASRLEGAAGAGEILISRAVYDALNGRIEAKSLGTVKLKGKSGEFEVFSVTRLM